MRRSAWHGAGRALARCPSRAAVQARPAPSSIAARPLASILLAFPLLAAPFPLGAAQATDSASGDAPAVEVVVRRAAQECFASLVHAFGYLVPRASAVVMFNAPDFRISEVRAKVGDRVRRGDVVALAIPAAPSGGAASQSGSQAAEVPIRSLASGTVLQASAFKGELMSRKSPPLFTLAIDGEIEAAVAVPSIHVGELRTGQAVHLAGGDGATYNGHVRLMPVLVDPVSQMGEVRVSLDGEGRPAPGRFLGATVEASRSCNLGVPRSALRSTSAGMQVEAVENGTVFTRLVRIGLINESDAEVVSGLRPGDLVVANAGSSLRTGDHVRPIFPDLQDAR